MARIMLGILPNIVSKDIKTTYLPCVEKESDFGMVVVGFCETQPCIADRYRRQFPPKAFAKNRSEQIKKLVRDNNISP